MFAVTIICSMSCSASPETRGMMSIQMPFSSRMNFDSPLSSSMVPRAAEFAFKISASSFADIKDSMTGAYLFKISSDAVPSRISLTSLYTPRTLELMIDFLKSYFVMWPSLSSSISAEKASLSVPAFREHAPFESTSGSIGITRSAKYTDVPRLIASSSMAEPSFT